MYAPESFGPKPDAMTSYAAACCGVSYGRFNESPWFNHNIATLWEKRKFQGGTAFLAHLCKTATCPKFRCNAAASNRVAIHAAWAIDIHRQ